MFCPASQKETNVAFRTEDYVTVSTIKIPSHLELTNVAFKTEEDYVTVSTIKIPCCLEVN